MPKGVRRSAEPMGPKIIELLNSDHLYADESKVDGADQSATGRGRFSK